MNCTTRKNRIVKKMEIDSCEPETFSVQYETPQDILSLLSLDTADSIPSFWKSSGTSGSEMSELPPRNVLYEFIQRKFFESVSTSEYTITSISCVENSRMFRAYQSNRTGIKEFVSNLNERFLWHGTREENVLSIVKTGFNRDFAKTTAYGQGVYFALNATYSVSGYSPANAKGVKHIFWCLLLCGSSIQGNSSMKGHAVQADGSTYETMVDNVRNPTIFVAPRDGMMYPVALVKFKRTGHNSWY